MNTLKKLFLTLIFITALTFAQQAQAQTKEYVSVILNYGGKLPYCLIVYPDGTTDKEKMVEYSLKEPEKAMLANAIVVNKVLNMLATDGYKLVSSTDTRLIFEK